MGGFPQRGRVSSQFLRTQNGEAVLGTQKDEIDPTPLWKSLADNLRRQIRGDVRFDPGSRALYATSGSNYRMPPIGVVLPRDADDVAAAVAVCRAHGVPV